MPIYTNIGGAQREIRVLCNNIGGGQRLNNSAYANISGSNKLIFQRYYQWGRYEIRTSSSGGSWAHRDSGVSLQGLGYDGSYHSCNIWYTDESNISVYSANELRLSRCRHLTSYYTRDDLEVLDNMAWTTSGDSSTIEVAPYNVWYDLWFDDDYYGSGDGLARARATYQITSKPTITESRGSYIGSVYSTNRNAYPNDGIRGSYWYVFVG